MNETEELQIKTEVYSQDMLVGAEGKSYLQRKQSSTTLSHVLLWLHRSAPHLQKPSIEFLREPPFCKGKAA